MVRKSCFALAIFTTTANIDSTGDRLKNVTSLHTTMADSMPVTIASDRRNGGFTRHCQYQSTVGLYSIRLSWLRCCGNSVLKRWSIDIIFRSTSSKCNTFATWTPHSASVRCNVCNDLITCLCRRTRAFSEGIAVPGELSLPLRLTFRFAFSISSVGTLRMIVSTHGRNGSFIATTLLIACNDSSTSSTFSSASALSELNFESLKYACCSVKPGFEFFHKERGTSTNA